VIVTYIVTNIPLAVGAPATPVFPNGDSQLDCGFTPFTQDDFLRLFRRIFPQNYIQPLELGHRAGYELLQAFASLWERMSLAAERAICSSQYLSACDGMQASGEVSFTRLNLGPAVIIRAGTILEASQFGGTLFRTTRDVTLPLNSVGPVFAPVSAVNVGYDGNLPGEFALPDGRIVPGAIDTFAVPFQDPAVGDPSIIVGQPSATTGGTPAALDQLGADRGIDRHRGEPANRYRARVRALPDTITPDAIRRVLTDVMQSLGPELGYTFLETFEVSYQTCWDAPPAAIDANPDYDPTCFVFDDPRPVTPFRNRWLSESDVLSGFIAILPRLPAILDFGMGYDDTAMVPGSFVTEVGRRAYTAYDITSSDAGVSLGGAWDGYDANLIALYVGIDELLTRIKAAGVDTATIVIQGE
jgi:hypothetical protein